MTHIDMNVEVRDTVIQKDLSTSVPSPLPMMVDEVAGDILKADGQKEDYAAPMVNSVRFMVLYKLEIRQGHGTSVSRKLATPLGYIQEVEFAVVETPSDQVVDQLLEKVPDILPYHSQEMYQGSVFQSHQ